MVRQDLELDALVQEACASLRAGAKLELQPQSDGTAICASGDQQVGKLTAQQVAGLPHPCAGTVRSVRQQAGKTIKVLVRFTQGAPPQGPPGAAQAVDHHELICCKSARRPASRACCTHCHVRPRGHSCP